MNAKTVSPFWISPDVATRRQRVSIPRPHVEIIYEPERKTVCWISGLWNNDVEGRDSSQLRFLKSHFPKCRFQTIVTPGHRPDDNDPVSIDDWVSAIRHQIEPHAPCSIISHSAGSAASVLFENLFPKQVTDMVMIAGSPLKADGIEAIPMQGRFLWHVLDMVLSRHFRLNYNNERFARGEGVVNLKHESGLVARQILLRQRTWFESLTYERLQCPSMVIAMKRDQFIPERIQKQIQGFHGSAYGVVDADHMGHCTEHGATAIAAHVHEFWAKLPKPVAITIA